MTDAPKAVGEYSKKALSLAIYPGQGEYGKTGKVGIGLLYVSSKLTGECGEFSEKVGKCLRDNDGVISEDRNIAMLHELGDVVWYINALCSETSFDFCYAYTARKNSLVESNMADFESDWGKIDKQLFYLANRMSWYATSIGSKIMHEEVGMPLYEDIRGLLGVVELAADKLGSTLSDIMELNLDKLFSRKDRGVLKGEGDDR